MKIALVIGHNSKKGGAYCSALATNEFDLYSKISQELKKEFNLDVFSRTDVGSYSKEMQNVLNEVHKNKYDLVLELHYNAYNGVARGSEVLRWHSSTKGKEYSEKFIKCTDKLGIPFRRYIEITSSSENGGYGIAKCKYPYLLLEPFFADNVEDCKIMKHEALVKLFRDYFKELGMESKVKVELTLEERVSRLEEKLNMK